MQREPIKQMVPLVKQVAKETNVPEEQVIDLFSSFGGEYLTKPFLFFDGCHCNENGYLYIA